jgi:hypothetical protein
VGLDSGAARLAPAIASTSAVVPCARRELHPASGAVATPPARDGFATSRRSNVDRIDVGESIVRVRAAG